MNNLEVVGSEDSYLVSLASILGGADRTALVMLYQPLCGYGAISLYLNLWAQAEHYKKGSAFSFENLTRVMGCELSEIDTFKNRLEGLGLLKTYLNEELRVFKYELYAPLTPKDFFTHELLGTLFRQMMPRKSYDKIKASFEIEKNDFDNYADITHKFSEVYNVDFNDVSTLKDVMNSGDNLVEKSNSEIESNFSLQIFLAALNEKKIKKSLITTNFVELLKSMASLYNLDECELCEIVNTSIEGVGNKAMINFDTFRSKCYSYRKIPVADKSEVKVVTDKRFGINKKAEMLKELDPFEFLKIKQNNQEASFQDIKLLEDLSYVSKLNPEVINVLIDYVMLKQDNKLPYNYVMKVADSLANAGVKTAEEAMSYFYKIRDKYNNGKNVSTRNTTEPLNRIVEKTMMPSEPVIEHQVSQDTKELDRLKTEFIERRKRKKQNATTEC